MCIRDSGQATYVKWYSDDEAISPRKQKSGISPNYVHSLDASCLQKTVIECNKQGIWDFAMIHDSYGTHATNCPTLNKTLREQYLNVFEVDQLEALLHQLSGANPEIDFPEIPEYGNADISQVLESKYFFS